MLNRITKRLFCQTRVVRCFSWLNLQWNKSNNIYHWYEVRYRYNNNGNNIFDWTTQIGLQNKKVILNARELKKIQTPLHKNKYLNAKRFLCNGQLTVEIVCYLGRFSK
jgi:hypothetical protein